ncbi:MAG: hypothetical protein IPL61_37290 [Myxococcales bacterium]|nr:hypothetical protein [Myxococcales bacterium]
MRLSILLSLTAALAAGGCAADTDERPAEFPYIVKAILEPSCATATCHSAQTAAEGLDFSSLAAAQDTFDSRALAPQTVDPNDSELLFILTTSGEKRMPVDSPMPDADIALIERWIIAGAAR